MKDLLDMQLYHSNMMNDNDCLENLPLAYAYVPYQQFEEPYDMEKAFEYGTVFSKLNKPYDVYGKEFMTKEGVKVL